MPTSPSVSLNPWAPHNLRKRELLWLLPELNRILLATADLRQAFPRICRRLHRVLAYKHAALALYESEAQRFVLYAQHNPFGESLPGDLPLSLEKTPDGEVYRSRKPLLVDDLRSPRFASETTEELLRCGRRSGCWVPLQTGETMLGTLSISAARPGAYRPDDAELLNEIAGQVSLALASQIRLQQLQALLQQLNDQIQDWDRSFRDIAGTAAGPPLLPSKKSSDRLGNPGVSLFDVVFHDPPFEANSQSDLQSLLALVRPGGWLFHERGDDEVYRSSGFAPADRRRYGTTRLLVFCP